MSQHGSARKERRRPPGEAARQRRRHLATQRQSEAVGRLRLGLEAELVLFDGDQIRLVRATPVQEQACEPYVIAVCKGRVKLLSLDGEGRRFFSCATGNEVFPKKIVGYVISLTPLHNVPATPDQKE